MLKPSEMTIDEIVNYGVPYQTEFALPNMNLINFVRIINIKINYIIMPMKF